MVMDRKEYYWSFGGGLLVLALVVGVTHLLLWDGNNVTKDAVTKTGADNIGAINGVGAKLERVATASEKACEKKKDEKSSIPASAPPAAVTPVADAPKFPVQYHVGQLGNGKTEIADGAMDEIMALGGEDAAQELIKLLQSPNQDARLRVCYDLVAIGPKAEKPLIEMWATADNDGCHRAMEIIVHIANGGDSVKKQLRKAMKDERTPVAYWARETMHKLCKKNVEGQSPIPAPQPPAKKDVLQRP